MRTLSRFLHKVYQSIGIPLGFVALVLVVTDNMPTVRLPMLQFAPVPQASSYTRAVYVDSRPLHRLLNSRLQLQIANQCYSRSPQLDYVEADSSLH